MIVISYYTKDTPYEKEVEGLKESLERFNLKHDIVGVKSLGSWSKNAKLSPKIILDMFNKYTDEDLIILIAADERVLQYPKLFDIFDGDIGGVYSFEGHMLCGVLILKNIPKVKYFIKLWYVMCLAYSDINEHDEDVFNTLIKQKASSLDLKIVELPQSYNYVSRVMKHIEDPVIVDGHGQQRYKHVINAGKNRDSTCKAS